MNQRITSTVLAAIAVLSFGSPAQSQPVTLTVATCLQRSHDSVQAFMQTFVEPLNAKNGEVEINYIGGPEVTPSSEQAPMLERGLVDINLCPAAYYGGLLSEARIPSVQNVPIEEIRRNGAWDMMEEAWNEQLNAHILSWVFSEGQVFYTYFVDEPNISEDTGLDLTGLNMRSTGLYNAFLQDMGANTITMSAGDIYAGLQRGVVDGFAWSLGSVADYGWHELINYRVGPSFFGGGQLLIINRDTWESLSTEQQDALNEQVENLETQGAELMVQQGEEDTAKLEAAGVEFIELSDEARRAYLRTIYDAKWAENDELEYTIDYEKLKGLVYKPELLE